MSVTPGRRVAGQDRRPGSGVAPRWRGSSDGWTLRMPCAGRSRSRRGHDLAVVGEHDERRVEGRDLGDRLGARSRSGVQDGTPSSAARAATGVDVERRGRPDGRAGAVTTPTSSMSGMARQALEDRHGERRRCRGRRSAPASRRLARPVTPGRSSPRGPRRRPRSRRRPAGARPSSRGSRCRACRRGGRARAGAPGRADRSRRP